MLDCKGHLDANNSIYRHICPAHVGLVQWSNHLGATCMT